MKRLVRQIQLADKDSIKRQLTKISKSQAVAVENIYCRVQKLFQDLLENNSLEIFKNLTAIFLIQNLIRGVAANSGLGFKSGPFLSLIFLHHVNNIEHNIKQIIYTVTEVISLIYF